MKTTLIYFRQDLRLADHRALTHAVKNGHNLVCCYVLDEHTPKRWAPGGAGRWWLHYALADLQKSLKKIGGSLILRRGKTVDELCALADQVSADAVYFSRNYEPFMQSAEKQLHDRLTEQNIDVRRFKGNILFDPDQVRTKGGTPFKVFTPFWRSCLTLPPPPEALPVPAGCKFAKNQPISETLEQWNLLPKHPDWAEGLRELWEPTEDGAHSALQDFLDDSVSAYRDARNIPSEQGTSRLSPFLHFGQISPSQVWHETQYHLSGSTSPSTGAKTFLSEIGWREFSYHLLHQFPKLPSKPFRANFEKFPWKKNAKYLRAWQQGTTGFPIIDAGMRELWHTGWMHNRVRMIVASFLVKDLLVPWQQGAAWFWDTLVDADLASNSASWQWVAGCGADAAPYFRIFNPTLQSEKFDRHGHYLRRWVPELAKLPDKWIHAPAQAPAEVLAAAGVTLGEDYPIPLIDRKFARQRALEAFQKIK